MVGTQFLRQLGPVVAAVDSDDLEPHTARVLDAEMAQPANAEHRDESPALAGDS